MTRNDEFSKLAKINAEAIQNLQPKITVWNTTGGGGNGKNDGNSSSGVNDVFRNILQCIPPLFTTISEQTGIKILPKIVEQQQQQQQNDNKINEINK